ncbi:hypothetical protein NDU88_001653 [Pleurodeles waltl]|uniref:Uncharacterized protein n=1 Tax=Pleurodeles waltl TaxID=8319 RepID=A0AAV7MKD0_PLEWA|nr:hypothetical protein NDU88_001653 [Pleurodeles waltl]
MGKSKLAKTPLEAKGVAETPIIEKDPTAQALRQMELTLCNHTTQFEKENPRRRPLPRTKPSAEQVAEERTWLLRETTRFVADPLAEASDHGNSDRERDTHSDSVDSLLGPLLTLRSANDI